MRLRKLLRVVVLPLTVTALQGALRAQEPAASTAPSTRPSDPDSQPASFDPPAPEDFHPLGFAQGKSVSPPTGAPPSNPYTVGSSDFLPVPDRWRIGLPSNYLQNSPNTNLDPFNQNWLKGDYAIPGTQDQFLVLTATSDTLLEARRVPVSNGVSTREANSFDFFGNGRSELIQQNFILTADYFIGDAAYKPRELEVRATGVLQANYVHQHELGLLDPDVTKDHDRTDYQASLQEMFIERKLTDLSPNYDIVSLRVGTQGFNNDFRGFLYLDNEPGVRLFGNYDNNKLQFNIAWFRQLEKDSNSGLNTFTARDQNVFFANVFRQDFFFPGYTAQLSFAANIDRSDRHFDTNGFLVRPAPTGAIGLKKIDAYYVGWAGDGHIGRFNITHQFYQAFGRENFNQLADRETTIDARFFAIELSYDADYIRYRTSFVYSSGDGNPQDGRATGFDSIFDNPNFAGGGFNFFTRQAVNLTGAGVNLVQRNSFIPDLRTSKEQGQANFVNPGLLLFNVGADLDVTQELTLIGNVSYLRFENTKPIQLLLQDNKISRDIGIDVSLGVRYRPYLSNNVIINAGAAALLPGSGFADIYSSSTLYSFFISVDFTY